MARPRYPLDNSSLFHPPTGEWAGVATLTRALQRGRAVFLSRSNPLAVKSSHASIGGTTPFPLCPALSRSRFPSCAELFGGDPPKFGVAGGELRQLRLAVMRLGIMSIQNGTSLWKSTEPRQGP